MQNIIKYFLILMLMAGILPAQAVSWSYAMNTTTILTIGLRIDPTTSRFIDNKFRKISPFGEARRPTGEYYLPDTRLFSKTCDAQHLRWIGIGDWIGPRIETQLMWLFVGAGGSELSQKLGASPTNGMILSMAGMTTYNMSRAFLIPGYHVDPLGYAAGIGSWGVMGSYVTSRPVKKINWRIPAVLTGVWMLTYPWSTPWSKGEDCE